MAFKAENLSVLSYANGFTLWHYKSEDLASDIDTSGYFNEASNILAVGDIIIANTDTQGTPSTGLYLVSSNASGVVDVTDMTVIGSANAD